MCHARETMSASTLLRDCLSSSKNHLFKSEGSTFSQISRQLGIPWMVKLNWISCAAEGIQTISSWLAQLCKQHLHLLQTPSSDPKPALLSFPYSGRWVFNQGRKLFAPPSFLLTFNISKCFWKCWEIAGHKGPGAMKKKGGVALQVDYTSWCFLELSSQKLNKASVIPQLTMRNNLILLNLQ